MIELGGTHVRLRSPRLEDIDALVAIREPNAFSPVQTADEARIRLQRQVEREPELGADGFLDLVIEEGRGQVIGDVQARAPEYGFPPGVCEIGIEIFTGARGRGRGGEAVSLITAYLLEEGWDRVQATTATDKCGRVPGARPAAVPVRGMLRAYGPGPAGREDYAMYAMTRADPR